MNDLWGLVLLLAGTYVVNTLAFVTAYALTAWWEGWCSDRRWRRERAAMAEAHTRGTPRGKR